MKAPTRLRYTKAALLIPGYGLAIAFSVAVIEENHDYSEVICGVGGRKAAV